MSFDHILLIGFGGPTKPEEVRPRMVPQISRPTTTPTTKGSEQEKKLKGYFPWLKL